MQKKQQRILTQDQHKQVKTAFHPLLNSLKKHLKMHNFKFLPFCNLKQNGVFLAPEVPLCYNLQIKGFYQEPGIPVERAKNASILYNFFITFGCDFAGGDSLLERMQEIGESCRVAQISG